MNLQGFKSFIEVGFKDSVSGKRHTSGTESDGTTSTSMPEQFTYTDIPCKISFPKPEIPNDSSEDDVPIAVNVKLFCKFDADIRQGDYVVANVLDTDKDILATYAGIIGLPKVYDTHKEVLLRVKESA